MNPPKKIAGILIVLDEVFEDQPLDEIKLNWHKKCRRSFMSAGHLNRCLDKPTMPAANAEPTVDDPVVDLNESLPYTPPTILNTPKMYLRSQASSQRYDKDLHCVVCVTGEENGHLNLATTYNTHAKLQAVAEQNIEVRVRLQSAFDAIAGDVKYHPPCVYLKKSKDDEVDVDDCPINLNSVFSRLSSEVNARLCRGHIVLISVCYDRFQKLCEEYKVSIPPYLRTKHFFKYKLSDFLPDIAVIPHKENDGDDDLLISSKLTLSEVSKILDEEQSATQDFKMPVYNENRCLELVHTALRLRENILSHAPNTCATLNEETAYESINEELYVFMAVLHGGSGVLEVDDETEDEGDVQDEDEAAYDKASKLRRTLLDACMDLTYSVSNGKIIPPKQYSLSLAVHQMAGRNKALVELLHNARQIMPYKKILQADTAIAKETLQIIDEETGAVVPPNMVHGRKTEFGEDNLDAHKQSVIPGNNMVNVTQHVAYQKGPCFDTGVKEINFSNETLKVPESLNQTIPLDKPIVKEAPIRVTEDEANQIFDLESPNKSNLAFRSSKAKDLAFNLIRNEREPNDILTNWTAYNRNAYAKSDGSEAPADIVAPLPILNSKADDHETINTVGERSKVISNHIGQEHVWLVSDQAVNAPAHEVKWTRGECIVDFFHYPIYIVICRKMFIF